ncbi:MAG TPA: type II toxin-antitoxin system VapC family toxin [Candidatus Korarchaeota archaeon]|nr:type II toxin-antitoxin system VapC family toxin [Candidatus Korarchaeota archaeon]
MAGAEVLDTNLLIEGRRGLTTIFNVIEYPPALKGSRILFPRKEDLMRALSISVRLRAVGKPVPAVDMVIAAMRLNRDIGLVTKNRHFLAIKEVEPDLRLELVEEG